YICPSIVGRGQAIKELKKYYKTVSKNKDSKDIIPQEVKFTSQKLKEERGFFWRELERVSDISMREFVGGIHKYKQGFRRETIKKIGKFFESEELIKIACSDLYWDKIISIEYVGEKPTYDLEIENYHNFIANGIVVHNSHSTAYAMISYRTAYLKANYPIEFMAALLTSERNNTDKIVEYVNEAERMKIKVLPPDINISFTNFTVTKDKDIRFGLMAIKNVGRAALESIIETRKEVKFENIFDFFEKVDSRVVNKKVIESLIKSGAMDSFKLKRAQMMVIMERVLSKGGKKRDTSQFMLFETKTIDEAIPDLEEWPLAQILNFEKTLLGIYLTAHPLKSFNIVNYLKRQKISSFYEEQNYGDVMVCGVVDKIKNITTRRKNERMAIIKLEDETANIEVFVFPRLFKEVSDFLIEKAAVVLKGRVEPKEAIPKILSSQIIPMDKIYESIKEVGILVENNGVSLKELKDIFISNKGTIPVSFSLKNSRFTGTKVKTANSFYLDLSRDALDKIAAVVGKENISLVV
ncbi:MAG: OB-fold nucleic acid binding domain-containing protein, partial [Candidatus Omnitrophota bacterium]